MEHLGEAALFDKHHMANHRPNGGHDQGSGMGTGTGSRTAGQMRRTGRTRRAGVGLLGACLAIGGLPVVVAAPVAADQFLTVATTDDMVNPDDGLLSLREAVDTPPAAGNSDLYITNL